MKKWAFPLAALLLFAPPVWAQQDELAKLRAEVAAQQAAMMRLLARIDALEKTLSEAATKEELEDEAKTQQDSVNSVRESLARRVNISGYSNFRYVHEEPERPSAFQLDHLGLIFGKQLGRFNFVAELELSNVPHHAEAAEAAEEGGEGEEGEEGEDGEEHVEVAADISGEGQVAVENAWMEYNHNQYLSVRLGKQLSPQYWWQHRYPNLTYSTTQPIYLRELFPPELIGVMVRGQVARPVGSSEFGVGYSLYASNNNFEGNTQADLRNGKAWGGRMQLRFPVSGILRRLDVAADIYRGKSSLEGEDLVDDDVEGFEGQLEVSRFLLNAEYARGESNGVRRSGYYVQPAVQLHPDWVSFYRVEQLESPRLQRAERRHLLGLNYRPFAQVALKGEWYRSLPLNKSFIVSEEERKSFNGFAAAAVFFF
jgi:hypothetical protein